MTPKFALRKTDPKYLTILKQVKTDYGRYEVVKNTKTGEMFWRVVARNGTIVASGQGLNSIKACNKGAAATERVLYALSVHGEI